MRKLTFLFLIITTFAFAQRNSNGYSVFAKGGMISSSKLFGKFGGSAGVSYVIGTKGFLTDVQVNYHLSDIDYNESTLPYQLLSLEFLGGYSIEKESLYPFYFNFKGGFFMGYERINKDSEYEDLYSTKLPYETSNFSYGVSVSPEVEIIAYDNISAILSFTQYFNLKSDYNKSYYTAFVGLKYYL